MKKIIIAVLSLAIFMTTSEFLHSEQPINSAQAAYKNPIKYKQKNYYQKGSCVWYAFERRAQMKRHVSNQWGNAKNWSYNAKRNGYVVSSRPVYGSVMISTKGYYGHAAVVERVNKNGSIYVSEMNWVRNGYKSYRTIPKSQLKGVTFIY